MDKYKLVGIKKKENKEGKAYYISYVLLENDFDIDILRILIKEKQVDILQKAIESNQNDISRYISIQYNNFNKEYKPVITLGL